MVHPAIPAPSRRYYGLSRAAPFTVDADYSGDPKALPRGGTTVMPSRTTTLRYALTWFGLAAALAGVFGAWAWSRLRPQSSGDASPAGPRRP